MIRLFTFLLLAILSFPGWGAATTFEYDWETLVTTNTSTSVGLFYQGNCFQKSLGDVWNSVELSTKYVRLGTTSGRLYTDSNYDNASGRRSCGSTYKTEGKHRNEIHYGYGKGEGVTGFQNWPHGSERWIRFSFYLPSDENSFAKWSTGIAKSKKLMILQLMSNDGAGDSTHAISFNMTSGAVADVQRGYATTSTKGVDIFDTFASIPLKLDGWNDFVIQVKTGWKDPTTDPNETGKIKIWHNCTDWASCTPKVDFTGRIGYSWLNKTYFKSGLYEGYTHNVGFDRQLTMYADAIKLAIRDAETDAQMLTLMSDVYSGGGGGGEVETGVITSVNAGNPIDSNDDVVVAATNSTAITACDLSNATTTLPSRWVTWDYATNTSGTFNAGDVSSILSTAGTVKCYIDPYDQLISMTDLSKWTTGGGYISTEAPWTGSDYYHTSGATFTTTAATPPARTTALGTVLVPFIQGDKIRYIIDYKPLAGSENNILISIGLEGVDKRIEARGTAGALVYNGFGGGWGSNPTVTNRTLGTGVYRAILSTTADATNPTDRVKILLGLYNATTNMGLTVYHPIVVSKNAVTSTVSKAVTFGVVDSTPPTVENCTFSNLPGDGSYTASLSCTATEIGGIDYAMITATNTSPNVAAVQAGTGALWASNKAATTTDIEFEANGFSYQDLYAWIVRCDAATIPNCSAVSSVAFSDGVTYVKRIKFLDGATRLRTRNGAVFGGSLDYFTLHPTDPRLPGPKTDLVLIDNPTITGGIPNFTEADTQCETCDGSINALPLGQYWYSARSTDGTVKTVNTINIVDAAE